MPPGATESETAPSRMRAVDDSDWLALAKHGAYAEAFTAARRAGWSRLCHRLDAHRLLTLGDVARYAGARVRAREAFEALVRRFPRDPLAADAIFSLGRLAFESEQSDRAARWFRRYVDDWPHGPLADQAVGVWSSARFTCTTPKRRAALRGPTWHALPADRTPRSLARSCAMGRGRPPACRRDRPCGDGAGTGAVARSVWSRWDSGVRAGA